MSVAATKQLGFDLGGDAAPSYVPEVKDVRAELDEVLAKLKASNDSLPWDARTFRYYRTVFPQMARWLPTKECDQLCAEFEQEANRAAMSLPA